MSASQSESDKMDDFIVMHIPSGKKACSAINILQEIYPVYVSHRGVVICIDDVDYKVHEAFSKDNIYYKIILRKV